MISHTHASTQVGGKKSHSQTSLIILRGADMQNHLEQGDGPSPGFIGILQITIPVSPWLTPHKFQSLRDFKSI